jgi:dCTP deaminase
MLLPDFEIMKVGPSVIDNFDQTKVQPTTYDLSLGPEILSPIYNHNAIDLRYTDVSKYFQKHTMVDIIPKGGSYLLRSGKAVLGSTEEYITCPSNIALTLEGKSSLARIFLIPHVQAGGIPPGFEGNITLEIVNLGPFDIILYPGMPIAQLSFTKLTDHVKEPYGSSNRKSRYQGQRGPTISTKGNP